MKTTIHSIITTREALAYMTGSALTRLGHRVCITSQPIPYDEYLDLMEPRQPGDPEDPTVEYVITATCDRATLEHICAMTLLTIWDLETPIEEQKGKALDLALTVIRRPTLHSK